MKNTVKNDFFWISQGEVATAERWGRQICKIFVNFFSGFNMPKNNQNRLISDRVI